MKKLALLIFLLSLGAETYASHVTGGMVTYTYIGDTSGIPYHYELTLTLYRRNANNSATLGNSFTVRAKSSCYNTQTYSLTRITPDSSLAAGDGGMLIKNTIDCIDPQAQGIINISRHVYKALVVLPGACADFAFEHFQCCRNAQISNITNPASRYIFIYANLNNLNGPQSTPDFSSASIPFFTKACLNQNVLSLFGGIEPDGDSISYSLVNPLEDNYIPVPHASGYSATSPFIASNFYFDPASGAMSFKPTQVQNAVIAIRSSEYRYDSTTSTYNYIGGVHREIIFNIVGSCKNDSLNWVSEFNDSLATSNELKCGDSILEFNTNDLFLTASLAPDGSDFALLNSRNTLVPIVQAGTDGTLYENLYSDSFWLKLHDTIGYDDTLTLVTRLGNDLNTLVNGCGEALSVGDTLQFAITTCNTGLSASQLNYSKKLVAYPNPVKHSITIDLPNNLGRAIMTLSNSTGQMVRSVEIYDQQNMNLDHLVPGIYFLSIESADWNTTQKIIKL